MFFSIITVCFNSAKTIRATLDSVLNQDCKEYEYRIVDGGSTDGTLEIIKEYEPKFEGRMHWTSEPDHGIYDAINKGIRDSKGELLNFLNSDDSYDHAHVLQEIIRAEKENPGGSVYYGCSRFMKNGKEFYTIRFPYERLPETNLNHQACFYRRKLFEKYGSYRLNYPLLSDYEFNLKLYLAKESFIPVDTIAVKYSLEGLSARKLMSGEFEKLKIQKAAGLLSVKRYCFLQISTRIKAFLLGMNKFFVSFFCGAK